MSETRKPLTDDFLDKHLSKERGETTYPTSTNPHKKCYEWEICEQVVVYSHPDDGYILSIKYFDGYDFDTREIRKIKYEDEVELIYLALKDEKLK